MPLFVFGKEERLTKRAEFLSLQREGRKTHTAHFVIIRSSAATGKTRIGITVSGKVGCAVVRNRIKRLVREYYRLHKENFVQADYNIIAKRGADRLDYSGVCRELNRVLSALVA